MTTYSEIENQFRAAMADAGIVTNEPIIADSKLHRFHVEGDKPGTNNGAYVLHADNKPAGYFERWGVAKATWSLSGSNEPLTPAMLQQIEANRAKRQTEENERHERAAKETQKILGDAHGDPLTQSYAITKSFQKGLDFGPGIKCGNWPQRGWVNALLIPMQDMDGKIWTLQAISEDGKKDFLKGGRKKEGFYPFGNINGAHRVLIGEGLATVAAVHAVDGAPAVVAMDAGNLPAVALAVRKLAPNAEIILLADNDIKPDASNPGLEAATKAAQAVGGRVAIPELNGEKCDFWDVWNELGVDAVKAQLLPKQSDPAPRRMFVPLADLIEKPKPTELDAESSYTSVDLLRHVPDKHVLKRLAQHVSEQTHLPVNTVFMIGLAAYSAMAARRYCLTYPNGKALPIGLYAVVEQPSGTGKSWCLNTFIEPFEGIHRDLLAKVQKSIAALEKRNDLSEFDQNELVELEAKAKRLNCGIYVSNATPEGLESTLHRTGGFFAAISSEQGLFNSLLGAAYKADGVNNHDMVLNGFDGGYVNSLRVSRQGFHGYAIGAVSCFAQQGSIETVLKASNGTGLSERFLMLAEPHMLGKRDHTLDTAAQPELEAEYAKACGFFESALDNPRQFEDLSQLEISRAGWRAIGEYRNLIEPHLADGGRFSHISLRGAASKINMQIMKIASVLHLLGGDQYQARIDDDTVKSAIGIANELLEAQLQLCIDKGMIGIRAEFEAIISYLSKKPYGKAFASEIKNSLKTTQPFKDATGSKAALIGNALDEMVKSKRISQIVADGKVSYGLV